MAKYQMYFDTLQGELKYDVDFGDDETIETVLHETLTEMTERGHIMKGLSTGDLKVVWGGAEGRELDLAGTLPAQGVKPNDVLRVLVESYEGGGRSLRTDRIEREWRLLGRLARANPDQFEIVDRTGSPSEEQFILRLRESPGLESARGRVLRTRDQHSVRLSFTRFFPDVPVECYLDEPLFHPNVRPETGFVCLWQEANPRDSAIQAIARVQAMAAYRMVNMGAAHQMNRMAADWYASVGEPESLVPLSWRELRVYDVNDGQFAWLEPGRTLSSRVDRRTK